MHRAAYQTEIWICANTGMLNMESPVGSGWDIYGDRLKPIFFEGHTTAEVLRGMVCGCKAACQDSVN